MNNPCLPHANSWAKCFDGSFARTKRWRKNSIEKYGFVRESKGNPRKSNPHDWGLHSKAAATGLNVAVSAAERRRADFECLIAGLNPPSFGAAQNN
jgi:hypothetical protein